MAQEWSTLSGRLDAALARRVDGYFAAFERHEPVAMPTAATADARPPAPEAAGAAPPPPEPTADELAAAEAARVRAEAADAAREVRRAARAALSDAVAALERATSDGQLAEARRAHAALAALRADSTDPGRELLARIAAAGEAHDELIRWQRWSNNKIRARLCAEVEALVGAGVHPDAVAAKVKEAQLAWQRLDESEALDPEAAAAGIAKRFRAACHHALAPTRKYFEKRRELRDRKLEQVDTLLADVERELESNSRSGATQRRRVVEALQRLDELDPRVRGEQGRRLRAMLTRIDAVQAERAGQAEAAKRKLIANLRRQLARAPLADALDKAKQAQAEWKQLGRASREVEDTLWQELRALIDPFFEKAGAQRAAEAEARNAGEAEARAILAELETLAAEPEQAAHADPRIAALMQRWRALPRATPGRERERRDDAHGRAGRAGETRGGRRGDRGEHGPREPRGHRDSARAGGRDRPHGPAAPERWDERAFDRAVERVRDAQRNAARAEVRVGLLALRDAAAICARIEDGDADRDALVAAFDALALPADAREAMRARLEAALAADAAHAAETLDANAEAGAMLAVRAELAAGTASPDGAKELRRRVQLERLAERMRGGASIDPRAEAREILLAWCGLGPMPAAPREALAQRIYAAFDSLDGA